MASKAHTQEFDPARYLDSAEAQAAYIEEAFETGDPAFVADAIGVVAKARGMSQVARDAGLSRESLYKALSKTGNPELATVLKLLRALGLRLSVSPEESSEGPVRRA